MKIWLDPNSPLTNFILGAALSGGDTLKAAKLVADERFDVSDVEQAPTPDRSTGDVERTQDQGALRP